MSAEGDQQKGTGQATRTRLKISQSLLKAKVEQGAPPPRIMPAHPEPAPARAELSCITR